MIPKVALGPLIIVWFKYGIVPNMLIAFSICVFPILLTTVRGLREVEPDLLDLVRTLRGSRWQVFTKIQLPGALPYIFSGMKVAAILAVAGAIVGEFLGSDKGLGYLMLQVQVTLDTAAMFMAVLLITLIGMLLYGPCCARARARRARCARRIDCGGASRSSTSPASPRPTARARRAHLAISDATFDVMPGELVPGRAVGMRQEHAAEDPRRPASARRRHGGDRLRGGAVRSGARHRHGVPAAAASEVAAHPRQRAAAGRDPRPAGGASARAGARRCWRSSASAGSRTKARTSSRAACSSAPRSRARWSTTPSWC